MKNPQPGYLIKGVDPASPAALSGIGAGWRLLRVDGKPVTDIIEYKILEADSELTLLVMDPDGYLHRRLVEKSPDRSLGLSFDPPTMGPLRRCGNRCLFCFIEQNPPGMRSKLYLKDDDYRLSFLYGNFITLNRESEAELNRIKRLNLSPLYVSVHTAIPTLRRKLFRSGRADRGLINLARLVEAGIKVHAQIVLCPGINDGEPLDYTISWLDSLGPGLLSTGLVPVGLTAHRAGLFPLQAYKATEARRLLDWVDERQRYYLGRRGSRFVYAADEFYQLAGMSFPATDCYEDYPQLENGIGQARVFLNELGEIGGTIQPGEFAGLKVTLATGRAGSDLLEPLRRAIISGGAEVNLVEADNSLFGPRVTVAGLLTGRDFYAALADKHSGDLIILPRTALRDDNVFLDGIALETLERDLATTVRAASGPRELLALLRSGSVLPKPTERSDRGRAY